MSRASEFRVAAWGFLRRLVRRFRNAHVNMLAAALAYYAAFSLGPLLLLLGGWLGVALQTRPELAARYREVLAGVVSQLMPLREDATELVTANFDLIVGQLSQGALLRSALSLGVLVWAASGFFTSLQLALEVIFDVKETRGFFRRRLVALLLVITVALVIAVEIVGGVLLSSLARFSDLLASTLQLPQLEPLLPSAQPFTQFTSVLLRLAVAALAFTLAFRFLPRRASSWLGALLGGAFSSVAIAVTRSLVVATFDVDRINVVYGVITGLEVTLLWLYLALLMFLLGALLSAELSAHPPNRRDAGTPRSSDAGG